MMQFPQYESYKDSGVDWLGKIPSHWKVTKTKYIGESIIGLTYDPKNLVDSDIGTLVLRSSNIQNGKITLDDSVFVKAKIPDKLITRENDILICSRNGSRQLIGKNALINKKMKGNSFGAFTTVFRSLCNSFIYYVFNSNIFQYQSGLFLTSTINQLTTSTLNNFCLPFPPQDEQQKIVNFLDQKTAEIDEAIAKKQKLIKLLQEQKAILINRAVTKGLNPNVPMRDSGIEWIGEIPEHWETISIKRTAKNGYKTFVDGDWVESPYITDEGIRLIQTGNIGIGYYKEKGFRYISPKTFSELNCTEVMSNDILICRLDGPVGRACLAPDLGVKMITSVDNAILKQSDNFDPRFIIYVMSSSIWLDWIKALCRVGGGFRFRISRSMLGDLKIPSPPLNEQTTIANKLDNALKQIETSIEKLQESIDKLEEYRQILISNAVTGRIKI